MGIGAVGVGFLNSLMMAMRLFLATRKVIGMQKRSQIKKPRYRPM